MVIVLILCLYQPWVNDNLFDTLDELTTALILLSLALYSNTILAYALFWLAFFKFMDGASNEIFSEILSDITVLISSLYYWNRQRKITK